MKAKFHIWLADTGMLMEDHGTISVEDIPQAVTHEGDYYRFKICKPPGDGETIHTLIYQLEMPAPDLETLREMAP